MDSPSVWQVGAFLREVPPLFRTEKPVSFDPVQTAFLQRLVRESALGPGVAIAKEDYFKGIVYLDYFAEVVAGRGTLLEDMRILAEELEKLHEYLDPTLEMVVHYSGLYVTRELKGEKLFAPSSLAQIAARHQRGNQRAAGQAVTDGTMSACGDSPEAPDRFYLALGRLVCDLFTESRIVARLGRVLGRNDLRAAIAADCILPWLPASETGEPVFAALDSGDFGGAFTRLLSSLVRTGQAWSLRHAVEQTRERLGRR